MFHFDLVGLFTPSFLNFNLTYIKRKEHPSQRLCDPGVRVLGRLLHSQCTWIWNHSGDCQSVIFWGCSFHVCSDVYMCDLSNFVFVFEKSQASLRSCLANNIYCISSLS